MQEGFWKPRKAAFPTCQQRARGGGEALSHITKTRDIQGVSDATDAETLAPFGIWNQVRKKALFGWSETIAIGDSLRDVNVIEN